MPKKSHPTTSTNIQVATQASRLDENARNISSMARLISYLGRDNKLQSLLLANMANLPPYVNFSPSTSGEELFFSPPNGRIISHGATNVILLAYKSLRCITQRSLVNFLCSDDAFSSSKMTSSIPVAHPKNPTTDLHEHLGSHRTTTIDRKPAKLSINASPYIISECR